MLLVSEDLRLVVLVKMMLFYAVFGDFPRDAYYADQL